MEQLRSLYRADVAMNVERLCDTAVEGNSMASRMVSFVDETAGKARDGAITAVDDQTVNWY